MNCISEKCEHAKVKTIGIPSKFFNSVMVPYCDIGKSVTYPFIDDGRPLMCDQYKKSDDLNE